jgi:uncharacterized protein YndB with AHSA1/START domain
MNRATYKPSPFAPVERHAEGGRWTLVFVRDLRHPPDAVWAALTDPGQLREWSPYTADRDLGSVGDATATMIDGDVTEDIAASVTQAERPLLLEYTLGTDVVRWELAATEEGTRLTLRHTVGEADWLPKAAAGWHLCVDVLERLLDGEPIGPIRGNAAMDHGWQDLHDMYAKELLS